jgi:hypothetical protein
MVLVHKKTETIPKTIFVDPRGQKLSLNKEKGESAYFEDLDILPYRLEPSHAAENPYGGLIIKYPTAAFF